MIGDSKVDLMEYIRKSPAFIYHKIRLAPRWWAWVIAAAPADMCRPSTEYHARIVRCDVVTALKRVPRGRLTPPQPITSRRARRWNHTPFVTQNRKPIESVWSDNWALCYSFSDWISAQTARPSAHWPAVGEIASLLRYQQDTKWNIKELSRRYQQDIKIISEYPELKADIRTVSRYQRDIWYLKNIPKYPKVSLLAGTFFRFLTSDSNSAIHLSKKQCNSTKN